MVDDEERLARAGLSAAVDTADARVARALRAEGAGGARGVWRWLRGTAGWTGVTAPPDLSAYRGAVAATDADALLAGAGRAGARLVVPGDPEWPDALDDLAGLPPHGAPCLGLWAVGPLDLAAATGQAVAVVGSRAATAYGLRVAEDLGAELGDRGWTVVSGAAYGVDGAAHRGALAAGGPTVAVLACGPDVDYPGGHAGLLRRLREEALVVAEVPPGSRPTRTRFLHRNRVIAALAAGTVVVEMGLRSGARSTATAAERLGRRVLVVPGPVTSALSAGCHRLLREVPEATLVTGAADVVEEVGRLGHDLAPRPAGPATWRDGLPAGAAAVLEAMPTRGPLTLDRLAVRARAPVAALRPALGALEAAGLVARVPGGWRLTAAGLAGTRAEGAARAEEEGGEALRRDAALADLRAERPAPVPAAERQLLLPPER